jgi:hypothetical protein
MNHSLYSSDRMTHLKIAVVGVRRSPSSAFSVHLFSWRSVYQHGLSRSIWERPLSRQAFRILWAINFQSFAKPI